MPGAPRRIAGADCRADMEVSKTVGRVAGGCSRSSGNAQGWGPCRVAVNSRAVLAESPTNSGKRGPGSAAPHADFGLLATAFVVTRRQTPSRPKGAEKPKSPAFAGLF